MAIAATIRGPSEAAGIEVRNPFDGSLVGTVPRCDTAAVRNAIDIASSYDARLTAWERYQTLHNFCRVLLEQFEHFARLIATESGKTLKDARTEVGRAYQTFLLSGEEAKRINGEVVPVDAIAGLGEGMGVVVREPLGVVAAITPFNFPLNLVAHKVGPAIAANNSVVLKPSSLTPLTALEMAELLYESGLPREMLQVVTGDAREIAHELVTSPAIAKLSFTGSVDVGHELSRAMAGLKTACLELGGNDPLIVMDDADVDAAIPVAIDGALGSNGERCTAIKRLIVHQAVADEFVSRFCHQARSLVVGDQLDPRTDVGPLISEDAAIEIEQRIRRAVTNGARLLTGGRREGALLWPSVLDHVRPDDPLVTLETFGPVAPFIRVGSLDEAIEVANGTRYGLQAGVFTRDIDSALAASRRLQVGAVIINNGPSFRAEHLPFGGVKDSGLGREGVRSAVEAMTRSKMTVIGTG